MKTCLSVPRPALWDLGRITGLVFFESCSPSPSLSIHHHGLSWKPLPQHSHVLLMWHGPVQECLPFFPSTSLSAPSSSPWLVPPQLNMVVLRGSVFGSSLYLHSSSKWSNPVLQLLYIDDSTFLSLACSCSWTPDSYFQLLDISA